MMTSREAQIYQWITEEPMISQEELAEKAGIKRSSAAVHISNLMKKGYILGKGYITNGPNYCTVIGGVNIDLGGVPFDELPEKNASEGKVLVSLGGVGRNIAHNMSLLGMNVKLITALGDDLYGHRIIEKCEALGIDLSESLRTVDEKTSTYIYIIGKDKKLRLGVSDMQIYDKITPDFISAKMDLINHGRLAVIDTNIPEDTIKYIADNCKVPLFAETVSGQKGKKLLSVLDKLHTITPSRIEAQELSGVEIKDMASLKQASNAILARGVRNVFITFCERGVFYSNGDESDFIKIKECNIVNGNGADDAFMAGLVFSYMRHLPIRETALVGTAAACITAETEETISSKISIAELARVAELEL